MNTPNTTATTRRHPARRMVRAPALMGVFLLASGLATGCGGAPDHPLPTATDVRAFYQISAEVEAVMNGNVAELYVQQDGDQLRRGGSTWARSAPYIYLFSEATQEMLVAWPGLAGLRVTTRPPSGNGMVATVFLHRDDLNAVTWSRALNVAGLARRDGTEAPGRMTDLITYGERTVTEYEYNPEYVP